MKKKGRNRVISALCAGIMLFSVLFFGSCTFSEGTKRSVELKLTTVEASVSTLRYVVEQFNKKNTEYRIKIEILPDSSLKDYNFSHGAIETDFISFENFTFATGFASSYTVKCNERNFNFIIFRFVSDDEYNCAINSFTILFKVNKSNRGVR